MYQLDFEGLDYHYDYLEIRLCYCSQYPCCVTGRDANKLVNYSDGNACCCHCLHYCHYFDLYADSRLDWNHNYRYLSYAYQFEFHLATGYQGGHLHFHCYYSLPTSFDSDPIHKLSRNCSFHEL